jgi:prepilin-type N-terminal cleavage/methylation domain-containing protein
MKNRKMKKAFTMVELAIVMVIIGLLVAAILKGAGMINEAKQKNLYKQAQSIQAAALSYYDKFSYYPGDDPNAKTHVGAEANGNGDGQIGTALNYSCPSSGSSDESCLFWEDARLANLLTGDGETNPSSAYGGAIAVGYASVNGISANWIAFKNVPGDVAMSIDQKYDDGKYNSGDIQGSGEYQKGKTVTLYFKLQ